MLALIALAVIILIGLPTILVISACVSASIADKAEESYLQKQAQQQFIISVEDNSTHSVVYDQTNEYI